MGVRAAHESNLQGVDEREVGDIPSLPSQESRVIHPPQPLSDAVHARPADQRLRRIGSSTRNVVLPGCESTPI
jgi:hypothetical protein